MKIATRVRAIERYAASMTSDAAWQIAIISEAQSLALEDEEVMAVLAIAKNRIIHANRERK